jgi:16S rRNA (adenine1518-N6/adenine1519-N6)-dimethyltransferase
MLTKSQLKEIFSKYNFSPLKRYGENYLIDPNIKDKIINKAHIGKDDVVLEIGPGLGALTIDLAESGAWVFAIEKDKKAYEILKDICGDKYSNLKLFNQDILEFDITRHCEAAKRPKQSPKIKVLGNLPYYVTTPIIEYLIENRGLIGSALIVIQKEVALRLLARPGTKDYGSISCFIQYYMKPAYLYTIKRRSFYPAPEVDSSLLRLEFLDEPSVKVADEKLFFKIVRGAFNQRRKTILNSLSREEVLGLPKDKLTVTLEKCGISPSSRPEDLSLADFAKISNSILA